MLATKDLTPNVATEMEVDRDALLSAERAREIGDLVMWDNTGTMHRVTPYDPDSGRLMNRTVLEGEEALV